MLNLLLKLLKKLRKRNWLLKLPLLIGRDRPRKLRLSQEDSKLLLPLHSKPKRLNSRLKDRDRKPSMMQL